MTNSNLSAGPTDLTLLKTIVLGPMKRPFETSFRLTLQPPSRQKTKTPTDLVSDARRRRWIELPCGLLLLVLILRIGDQIKSWLHLPIPGSVLGLFILLICFRLQLLSPRLFEEASSRLLFILPALFIRFTLRVLVRDNSGRRWQGFFYPRCWLPLLAFGSLSAILASAS